jgi:hypothetical protein
MCAGRLSPVLTTFDQQMSEFARSDKKEMSDIIAHLNWFKT